MEGKRERKNKIKKTPLRTERPKNVNQQPLKKRKRETKRKRKENGGKLKISPLRKRQREGERQTGRKNKQKSIAGKSKVSSPPKFVTFRRVMKASGP